MNVPHPDIASCLSVLNNLTDDELKELLNSEANERYDEYINQIGRYKQLESERDLLVASVRSLAEFNLSKQADYESDRSKLLALVSESNRIVEAIQQKEAKLIELTKRTSLESTLATVLKSTSQTEEESESIAKQFLDQVIDHETFIKEYCQTRKLAHSRRIKADVFARNIRANA